MTLRTRAELQALADEIASETDSAQNTAARVGGLLRDLSDSLALLTISATARFLGRFTTGAGPLEEMTPTEATSLLNTVTTTLKGLAPPSGGGVDNFLRADLTWAPPPGGGGGGGPPLSNSNPAPLGTADPGVSTAASRADHVHAHGDLAGGTLHATAISGGAAGFLSGSDKAKVDGVAANASANATSGSPAAIVSSGATIGSAPTAAPSDHSHNHGDLGGASQHAAVTTTVNGFMSAADKVKLNSCASNASANATTGSPAAIVSSGATIGSAGTAAPSDHTHDHGNLGGGSQHTAATTVSAGFMSAADKTKLDGVATGATAVVLSNANPVAPAETAGPGISGEAARIDHIHPLPGTLPARGTENVETDIYPRLQAQGTVANGASVTLDMALATGKIARATITVWVENGSGGFVFFRDFVVWAHNTAGVVVIEKQEAVGTAGVGYTATASVSGTNVRTTLSNASGSTGTYNMTISAMVMDKP